MRCSRPQAHRRATARYRQSWTGRLTALPESCCARTALVDAVGGARLVAGCSCGGSTLGGSRRACADAQAIRYGLRRDDGHDVLREAVLIAENPRRRASSMPRRWFALRLRPETCGATELCPASHYGAASSSPAAAAHRRSRTGQGRSYTAPAAGPRREALSGPEPLTPSQRRVAELAAEGRSNRDIAQPLYVTPKTVEVHLTSIYRKLGISTRATLPRALAHDAA